MFEFDQTVPFQSKISQLWSKKDKRSKSDQKQQNLSIKFDIFDLLIDILTVFKSKKIQIDQILTF